MGASPLPRSTASKETLPRSRWIVRAVARWLEGNRRLHAIQPEQRGVSIPTPELLIWPQTGENALDEMSILQGPTTITVARPSRRPLHRPRPLVVLKTDQPD